MLKVFIAGATGWAGSALSKAIYNHPQMQLVGGLSRNYKNKNLAEVLNLGKLGKEKFLYLVISKLLSTK